MSRLLVVMAACLLVLGVVACGTDTTPTQPATNTPTAPSGGMTPQPTNTGTQPTAAPTEVPEVDFSGKTIRIVVGYEPGGTYDFNARILSQHMPKYLKGEPTIIIENRPGGGGVVAMNYVYGQASNDGFTLGSANPSILNQVAGTEGFLADFTRMPYLGAVTGRINTCYVRSDTGVESLQDLIDSPTTIPIGSTGSVTAMMLDLFRDGAGANIQVVPGYAGQTDSSLAIEQNEIAGTCIAWIGIIGGQPEWIESGFITPYLQVTPDGRKEPTLQDVEVIQDYRDRFTEAQFNAIIASVAADAVLFSIFFPPDSPPDIVAAMQDAFWDTVNDPAFVADIEASGRDVNPTSGPDTEKILRDALQNVTPEVKEILMPYIGG